MNQKPIKFKSATRGLSLVEFMVSIAVGLIILSSVIATLTSALQTRSRKVDLESAMESYRFAAQALTTKIKNACSINATSTAGQIVLNNTGGTSETITHSSSDYTIRISNNTASNQILVDRIFGLTFDYGVTTNPSTDRIADGSPSEYTTSAAVTAGGNWNNVRSVKITIKLLGSGTSEGLTETIIATLRAKMLASAACI